MIADTVGRQVSFKNKRGGMITGRLILIERDWALVVSSTLAQLKQSTTKSSHLGNGSTGVASLVPGVYEFDRKPLIYLDTRI